MKNKSARRFSYFYTQRIHARYPNNLLGLVKLRVLRIKVELENIPRWEDDGGLVKDKGVEPSIILNSNH